MAKRSVSVHESPRRTKDGRDIFPNTLGKGGSEPDLGRPCKQWDNGDFIQPIQPGPPRPSTPIWPLPAYGLEDPINTFPRTRIPTLEIPGRSISFAPRYNPRNERREEEDSSEGPDHKDPPQRRSSSRRRSLHRQTQPMQSQPTLGTNSSSVTQWQWWRSIIFWMGPYGQHAMFDGVPVLRDQNNGMGIVGRRPRTSMMVEGSDVGSLTGRRATVFKSWWSRMR